MASKLFQRKNFLIKPHYQLRIVLSLLLSFTIYSIILALILFYPLANEFYSSVDIHEQAAISKQVLSLHTRLWPAILVVAFLMALQIIFISHRIFGPIYRFEQTVKKYLLGDFSIRIRLRKRDEFKDLEALLNKLAEYVEDSRSSAKEKLAQALKGLESSDETKKGEALKIISGLIVELDKSEEI